MSIFSLSGCATVFRGTEHTFDFGDLPDQTEVTVFGRDADPVFQGNATEPVSLRRKESAFESARYRVVFEHPDYQSRQFVLEPEPASGATLLSFGSFLLSLILGVSLASEVETNDGSFSSEPDTTEDNSAAGVLLFVGGIAAYFVDGVSGSWVTYRPTDAEVELVPIASQEAYRLYDINDLAHAGGSQ